MSLNILNALHFCLSIFILELFENVTITLMLGTSFRCNKQVWFNCGNRRTVHLLRIFGFPVS
jgi:hypothetical protein